MVLKTESIFSRVSRLSERIEPLSSKLKIDICFLIAARIYPYYRNYADKTDSHLGDNLRSRIFFLWEQYKADRKIDEKFILEIERLMPEESQDAAYVCAQNAIICAINLAILLNNKSHTYVERCITAYFDNIDFVSQEKLGMTAVDREFTEIAVGNSAMFIEEYEEISEIISARARAESVSEEMLYSALERTPRLL